MLTQRRSGILLHPTSLPGAQAIGSLGQEAYDFVDFLVAAGQSVWQILPLGPTGYGNCPYSSFSAFAGNPLLINLQQLVESGDLRKNDTNGDSSSDSTAHYDRAIQTIIPTLNLAADNFKTRGKKNLIDQFTAFCFRHSHWLDDFAFFQALRETHHFTSWQNWPQPLRHRDPATLSSWRAELKDAIYRHQYQQFIFYNQWAALKHYANHRGIMIFGDLPFFVAEDSADVWANQKAFKLDHEGRPLLVAGVPPDYFSPTGQRWGNPLYDWETMEGNGFDWWIKRFRWNFELFDLLRVDHFRGFSACWAIPANQQTAENGSWVTTPGEQLFEALLQEFDSLPIIAEDLGIITPDVIQLRDQYHFPGMKILQFAFDSGDDNPYLPHNHIANSVVYTGTHDNNTTFGWWESLDEAGKQKVRDLLQQECDKMPWCLIETALSSDSLLTMLPLQDLLSLPAACRMNTPGTPDSNWQWRLQNGELTAALAAQLKHASHLYSRNLCISTEIEG